MIVKLTEMRDSDGALTHRMCVFCFKMIPVKELYTDTDGNKWDSCGQDETDCSERKSMLKIEKFIRKSSGADVVQVTAENIEEAAAWCRGDVRTAQKSKYSLPEKYIKVRVYRPEKESQTMAFIGDLILYIGTGYKVFTPVAFEQFYERVKVDNELEDLPLDPCD